MWYAYNTGEIRNSSEQEANATEIYNILSYKGYSLTAICAILANIYRECGYNPWQWERGIQSTTSYRNQTGGYGLMQFTPWPPTPFPNIQPYVDSSVAQTNSYYAPNFSDRAGSPSDGHAQIDFMDYQIFTQSPREWFAQTPGQPQYNAYLNALNGIGIDYTRFYNMTGNQFKIGSGPDPNVTYNYNDWIGAFATCYLRPTSTEVANNWYSKMVPQYQRWYQYFSGIPPTPPDPPIPPGPTPTTRHKMPIWMMIDYDY